MLIAAAVVILPFLVGSWLAKRLRMSEYGWKLGVILFSLTAGIVICVYGWPPRLGMDLSGGVTLVYEVDASKTAQADLSNLVDVLRRELNAEPSSEIKVDVNSDGNVEVSVPSTDAAASNKVEQQVDQLKNTRLRQDLPNTELVLESRLAREGKEVLVYGVRQTGTADMDLMISRISKRINPGGQKEVTVRRMGSDRVEVIIPQVEKAEVDVIKNLISTAVRLSFVFWPMRYARSGPLYRDG